MPANKNLALIQLMVVS